MNKRDNFTQAIKKIMAERVAWRCSFPDCGVITIGPKMGDDSKSMNLGEAAHINAAAQEGPRYDSMMSSEQRRSIKNGIWMCRSHATLIDSDFKEFSAETLRLWKAQAEEMAYKNLKYQERYSFEDNSTLIALGFEIIVNGYWSSASHGEWSFELGDFLKGSKNDLDLYISNFYSVSEEQRFILVESQGDARKIKEPMQLVYGKFGKISIVIKIAEKYQPVNPNMAGWDIAIGEDGDISIENGDIKMVSGIDAAIQHLTLATSTVYGSWFADPKMGSFISEYYRDYHDDLKTLARLIKLEFIRLSLIPAGEDTRATLGYVNRFDKILIESIELVNHQLSVGVELEWGNNEKWSGRVPVWIDET